MYSKIAILAAARVGQLAGRDDRNLHPSGGKCARRMGIRLRSRATNDHHDHRLANPLCVRNHAPVQPRGRVAETYAADEVLPRMAEAPQKQMTSRRRRLRLEQRRFQHLETDPQGSDAEYVRALVAAIRQAAGGR
jgi:hypothetical protein